MRTDTHQDSDWQPFGLSIPQLLLVLLTLSLCISVFFVATTTTTGFSPYNPDWDGTREFRNLASTTGELTVATDTNQYGAVNPDATTAFVFAPTEKYADADKEAIGRFVQQGGMLVIADTSDSYGNDLLGAIGASAQFDGRILRDEQHNLQSSALPKVSDTSNHQFVSNVSTLTLNYGTAVEPGESRSILNSSSVSYLSRNGTDTLTGETELRSYSVVTVESVGNGTIVTVGDPSIFISSMLDESDNKKFASTILNQRSNVLLDQSHTPSPPPLVAVMLALRSSSLTAAAVLVVVIGLLLGGSSWYNSRYRSLLRRWIDSVIADYRTDTVTDHRLETGSGSQLLHSDPETIRNVLQERHPEWDEEQIDRVIAGVLSDNHNNMDNE